MSHDMTPKPLPEAAEEASGRLAERLSEMAEVTAGKPSYTARAHEREGGGYVVRVRETGEVHTLVRGSADATLGPDGSCEFLVVDIGTGHHDMSDEEWSMGMQRLEGIPDPED